MHRRQPVRKGAPLHLGRTAELYRYLFPTPAGKAHHCISAYHAACRARQGLSASRRHTGDPAGGIRRCGKITGFVEVIAENVMLPLAA